MIRTTFFSNLFQKSFNIYLNYKKNLQYYAKQGETHSLLIHPHAFNTGRLRPGDNMIYRTNHILLCNKINKK